MTAMRFCSNGRSRNRRWPVFRHRGMTTMRCASRAMSSRGCMRIVLRRRLRSCRCMTGFRRCCRTLQPMTCFVARERSRASCWTGRPSTKSSCTATSITATFSISAIAAGVRSTRRAARRSRVRLREPVLQSVARRCGRSGAVRTACHGRGRRCTARQAPVAAVDSRVVGFVGRVADRRRPVARYTAAGRDARGGCARPIATHRP